LDTLPIRRASASEARREGLLIVWATPPSPRLCVACSGE
jgi:hypothetical protein